MINPMFARSRDGLAPAVRRLTGVKHQFQQMHGNMPIRGLEAMRFRLSQILDFVNEVLPVDFVEPAGSDEIGLLLRPGVKISIVQRRPVFRRQG